jgi:hypothetical protein
MILAMTAGTFACGGDDDDDSATSASDEVTGATQAPEITAAPQADPECDDRFPLVTYEFNDRCEPGADGWGAALASTATTEPNTADSDSSKPDATWHTSFCKDLIAVPNELIVATDPSAPNAGDESLSQAIEDVMGRLEGVASLGDGEPLIAGDTALLQFQTDGPNETIPVESVLRLLPSLQEVGRSVDLNYLEPLQPNDGFRPYDDPHNLGADQPPAVFGGGEGRTVLVIDSPSETEIPLGGTTAIPYDAEPNGYIDEDHGHGVFVRSIIERSGATAELVGVTPDDSTVLAGDRWSPMTFSDFDIIKVLNASKELSPDIVNLSLGGSGCTSADLDHPNHLVFGIGERLALGRVMRTMWNANPELTFVAAAGNNGEDDILHFPAAWRHHDVTLALIDAVTNNPDLADDRKGLIAAEIDQIHTDLTDVIYAVGSLDEATTEPPQPEQRSSFSNYGCWVNAAAFGRDQIGEYPSATSGGYAAPSIPPSEETSGQQAQPTYAKWSGTSFATANFTAALAIHFFDNNRTAIHSETGARILDDGFDCPQTTPTTTTAP